MDTANPKVNAYLSRVKSWQAELTALRTIIAEVGPLTEEFKWGHPCYALDGSNICLIHGFKDYCAVLFMKGALLKDPKGILVRQTEHVQSARQIRYTSVAQVTKLKAALKAYVKEAIAVEKAGLTVARIKPEALVQPEEFQCQLSQNLALKQAFEALTPGRQRAYYLYFSSAKQSKTRQQRVIKSIPRILDGKGIDDR